MHSHNGKIISKIRKEEAPTTATMAATTKTTSMPNHKCFSLLFLLLFAAAFIRLRNRQSYKSDLLVAIDRLKQCTLQSFASFGSFMPSSPFFMQKFAFVRSHTHTHTHVRHFALLCFVLFNIRNQSTNLSN